MRAIFGLVALLVGVGVIVWIFSLTSIPTAKVGKEAQDQTRQLTGRGQDGEAAVNSFKIEPDLKGSRLEGLDVTDVTAGGAVDQFYGLKKGDRIVQVSVAGNMMKVGEASNDDPEMAKAKVHEAFQASSPIVVVRGGRTLTLPQPSGAAAAAPPSGSSADATAQPAAAQPPRRTNVYDQVNGVTKGLQGADQQ